MDVSKTANPLLKLKDLGQSIWLDDIRRAWLEDGTLARLIADDGLAGVTSNPAIFEKAISKTRDYDAAIGALARAGASPPAIYDALTIDDVRRAADLFRPLHERTGGADGFVSLEVSPHLAHDTRNSVAEAHRLWERLDRPNVMIKIPGTRAGLQAVRELITDGVNVNVTLLFSVARYRAVVEAFMAGLEQRARERKSVDRIASVASFFLSRIDTLVDRLLDAIGTADAAALRGQAAIACARLAYQNYREEWRTSARWQALAGRGAHPQRLLWASTSTKDEAYGDLKYVEALVGPDTVNTLPPETLAAYRGGGRPVLRLENDLAAARALPQQLGALGIDLETVAETLEREGVRKFIEPYDALLRTLAQRTTKQ